MSEAIQLLSIEDLESLGVDQAQRLLSRWNPSKETLDWSASLAKQGRPYPMQFVWNLHRRPGVMHATSFSQPCDRYLQLELLRTQATSHFGPSLTALLDTGTAVGFQLGYYHVTLAEHLGFDADLEYDIYKHSDFAKSLRIGGRADLLVHERTIVLPTGQEVRIRHIDDFKSINEEGFQKLRRPAASYVRQQQIYMACTNTPVSVLLYMHKDTSRFAHFILTFDVEIWEAVRARAQRVLQATERGESLEPRDGRGCNSCQFSVPCRGAQAASRTGRHRGLPRIRS